LRQELRELEILDEITKLRYEGSLPDHINGNRRNVLIRQFQEWKGDDYVPPGVHAAIRWNKRDPFEPLNVVTDSPWKILKPEINKPKVKQHKSDTAGFVAARGSVPVPSFTLSWKKRKTQDEDVETTNKRQKTEVVDVSDIEDQEPQGLIWDGQNYSCAYDSLMTILFSIWSNDTKKWNRRFKDMNRTMNVLSLGFNRAQENKSTLEMARNKVRHLLHQRKPQLFPYGQAGTSISEMAEDLLRSDNVISSSWYRCNNCKQETNMNKDLQTCVVQCPGVDCTTSECMKQLLKNQETGKTCINCGSNLDRVTRFNVIQRSLYYLYKKVQL